MDLLTYQDKWLRGERVERGVRECAERYEIVRGFCERFERPFTVCDVGANMCYFGLRILEDFPQGTVMAFESNHFDMRKKHVEANRARRLLLFDRRLSLADVDALKACTRFDLVLALSVFHHLPGSFHEWMKALRSLGDYMIAEFALNDSHRVKEKPAVPEDAVVLGYGQSHLARDTRRPIVLLAGQP